MNRNLKRLRDLVLAIDRADRNVEPMTPDAYRSAAKAALALTHSEMGLIPIGDFAGPVTALQTTAENIFFGIHGCFADIDSTGRAPVAQAEMKGLLARMRMTPAAAAEEFTRSLVSRLCTGSARKQD